MAKSLPAVSANGAFFIDFDGTLVEIAARPELVEVEARARRLLEALRAKFGGAVAVVTGRSLDVVDGFLAPLRLPVAAEHGSVRRDASGRLHTEKVGSEAVKAAAVRLEPLVEANPGLLLERKLSSVALHYRQRPELAEICAAAVQEARAQNPGLLILPGKMVFELRPAGVDKGTAVAAFMAEAPFRGRSPVYIGDDVTDEHAFDVVNKTGGMSIKIGDRDSAAVYRTDRKGFFDWAERLAGIN